MPPCGKGIYIRWKHLIFLLLMYMVQLYEEDWTILHVLGCWAIALPSTKQIAQQYWPFSDDIAVTAVIQMKGRRITDQLLYNKEPWSSYTWIQKKWDHWHMNQYVVSILTMILKIPFKAAQHGISGHTTKRKSTTPWYNRHALGNCRCSYICAE